ncbi:MAG TPA: thioredoxin domain-containing protein [Micromonosporaceae bacterium]|nr:thioredoxin domain-containing protein [Micromonosporaceae bacterium]
MNRLGDATSPYLLQHADNPVDWWPWGAEALAEAKRRDVPVLISVGYAACHWCHVMAHESFENQAVAELVNELTVPVKVDREERPDVDAVYMAATQAMTGQGGWPMTVFATPDGQPFYCGTYFPRQHFVALVQSVTQAWHTQREAVLRQGAAVVEAIAGRQLTTGPTSPMSAEILAAAATQLANQHDEINGGFGDAPKFPPHLNLLFLLRYHQRTGDPQALEIVRHTAEQMARGGIYDQLAGGFARYSVDSHWTVPHFEKMLYDNALLLRVYTELFRQTGDPLAARVARETASFLCTDLRVDGGFASALDADTDGVEGATYVWTPDELRAALGVERGDLAADLFAVTEAGTFEHGTSVLRLARDVDAAPVPGYPEVRAHLRAARAQRAQPARDDKVVAAWNGLAITALVEYSRVFAVDTPAREVADRLALHIVDGRLRRVSRDGVVGEPAGVLDDYGCLAEAFCAVHQLTGEGRWLQLAGRLLDTALEHFRAGNGGFHDTADDAERLVTRPADPTDNAYPAGLSAIAAALTTYAALTGEPSYREAAQRALATVAPIAARHPRFTGYACAAGEALLSGPYEIAITGAGSELLATAIRLAPPGAVIVTGEPDQPGVPLLAGRSMIDGRPTAYVCKGFVCDRPVTSAAELATQLGD